MTAKIQQTTDSRQATKQEDATDSRQTVMQKEPAGHLLATSETTGLFTMWGHGYYNKKGVAVLATRPKMTVDIGYVYHYIRDGWAREQTAHLVEMLATTDNREQQAYKALNFETVTFAGRFSYRNAQHLIAPSPYMVLDVDHLGSTERAREVQRLFVGDRNVETALCFLSPRQEGVKWVITLPEWCDSTTYRDRFLLMADYVGYEYGITVDADGSDINRTCYLSYDPQCYCHPKFTPY